MSGNYKEEKEAFVSGMTGSSITHVTLVSLVALSSVVLYAALKTRTTWKFNILTSWTLLVLPLLLSMTLFGENPLLLNLLLLIPTVLILVTLPKRESGPSPLPSKQTSPLPDTVAGSRKALPPLPALTTYRAHMMLMTVLAILAVDFRIFPRSLAKCETFGVSMMDLGVGSFVFSQGMVSAIPLLRNPAYLHAAAIPKLVRVTKKCLPIIALGVVRVVMVKGTEYPEHVTEYGVHWNFFITLALTPILQVLIHPLLARLPIALVGIALAGLQQAALTQLGLAQWVLDAPRTGVISANKEGLVSLPGYFAIHILGLAAGTLVLPPSPSFFRRQQKAGSHEDLAAPRQLTKTATELCAYSALWWSLLGISRLIKIDGAWGESGGVSRRMVNLPYILWVAAYNVSFILAYLVVLDIFFFPNPVKAKSRLRSKATPQYAPLLVEGNPPRLLDAINNHSLTIFLLANLMTGVVNLTVKTMYATDSTALAVLSLYAATVCGIAWVWDIRWASNRKEKRA